MHKNLGLFILTALMASLVSCGNPSSLSNDSQTRFSDAAVPAPSPGKRSNVTYVERQSVSPTPAEPPTLLTSGTRQSTIPAYTVPEKLRARLDKIQPGLLPAQNSSVQILNQHLKIDAQDSSVTFSGTLRIPNRPDEALELRCTFDKSESPWMCSDMFPTNEKIAAEKRLQGTFKCLDSYRCNQVGVAVYVMIDGKLQGPLKFQAEGFQVHKISSGDVEEDALPQHPSVEQKPQSPTSDEKPLVKGKLQNRVPLEPEEVEPPAPKAEEATADNSWEPEEADLSDDELDQVLREPDWALEITEPMNLPTPSTGKYSIPEVEKLRPKIGNDVPNQAIGTCNAGSLKRAAELPAKGPGFISRDHGQKDFGTNLTVQMLTESLGNMNQKYPGRPPVTIGNVANRTGGRITNLSGYAHKGHQNGLDMDVAFPSTKRIAGLWAACSQVNGHCPKGAKILDQLDEERFWLFLRQMTCAAGSPVNVMFVDGEVKRHMCRYAREHSREDITDPKSCTFKTLRALKHLDGHYNHVHVRLRCPGNEDCRPNSVILANGIGC